MSIFIFISKRSHWRWRWRPNGGRDDCRQSHVERDQGQNLILHNQRWVRRTGCPDGEQGGQWCASARALHVSSSYQSEIWRLKKLITDSRGCCKAGKLLDNNSYFYFILIAFSITWNSFNDTFNCDSNHSCQLFLSFLSLWGCYPWYQGPFEYITAAIFCCLQCCQQHIIFLGWPSLWK